MRSLSLALEHDASWETIQREALKMRPVILENILDRNVCSDGGQGDSLIDLSFALQ